MPVYPDSPKPLIVTPRVIRAPSIVKEFDGIYTQGRALANRALRAWTLSYGLITIEERDVIDAFLAARRGRAEPFDVAMHTELLEDPGFERKMESAPYVLPTVDLVFNPGFENGNTSWFSDVGTITVVNEPSNARTGNWVAKKVTGVAEDNLRNPLVFDVRPNELFYVEGWVKSTSDAVGNVRVGISWLGADGLEVAAGAGNVFNGPQTSYVRSAGFVRAPALAVKASFVFHVDGHTAGTWYFDDTYARRYEPAWYQLTPYQWAPPFLATGTRDGGIGTQLLQIPSAIGVERRILARQLISVTPNSRVLLSYWVKAAGAGATSTFALAYSDRNGAFLNAGAASSFGLSVPTYWRRYFSYHTVPVGASYAETHVKTDSNSTAAVLVSFDDLSVRDYPRCRFAKDEIEWRRMPGFRYSAEVELVEAP